MKPIKVIVASPSAIGRARITKALSALTGIEVIAMTSDLSETFTQAEAREPDLVVMAQEFCRVDEFDSMKSLFYALDARWIECANEAGQPERPAVRMASGQMWVDPVIDAAMPADTLTRQIDKVLQVPRSYAYRPRPVLRRPSAAQSGSLVVIGSSTGGIDALLTLLSDFPVDCPPTAIVQHTGRAFSESLIRLLDRRCPARVVLAQDGMVLRQGMVCVAGGTDGHLGVKPGNPPHCVVRPGPATSGHTPSVDELFRSVLPFAPKVVGVLLTGMGQDGAAGLLALRRAGCTTIGQDEATSVVYGMPKAAFEMGAVQQQVPIHRIASEILRACAEMPDARRMVR